MELLQQLQHSQHSPNQQEVVYLVRQLLVLEVQPQQQQPLQQQVADFLVQLHLNLYHRDSLEVQQVNLHSVVEVDLEQGHLELQLHPVLVQAVRELLVVQVQVLLAVEHLLSALDHQDYSLVPVNLEQLQQHLK